MTNGTVAICTEYFDNLAAIKNEEIREAERLMALIFLPLHIVLLGGFLIYKILRCCGITCECSNGNNIEPITLEPHLFLFMRGLKERKHPIYLQNGAPVLRIFSDTVTRDWDRMFWGKEIDRFLSRVFNRRSGPGPLSPGDYLVCIRMNGFKHGIEPHDFIPINGESSGSYYNYQMFGDQKIQITNYIENGKSYVAGFCINTKSSYWGSSLEQVVERLMDSEEYPGRRGGGVEEDEEKDGENDEGH